MKLISLNFPYPYISNNPEVIEQSSPNKSMRYKVQDIIWSFMESEMPVAIVRPSSREEYSSPRSLRNTIQTTLKSPEFATAAQEVVCRSVDGVVFLVKPGYFEF